MKLYMGSGWIKPAVGLVMALFLGGGTQAWAQDGSGAAKLPTMQLAKIKSKLLPGDKIGKWSAGIFCFSRGDLPASEKIDAAMTGEAILAFRREMAAANLPVFDSDVSAFDSGPANDPDYRLGGTVTGINYDVCSSTNGVKGNLHIEVKWELFAVRQQRVVYTLSTQGDYLLGSFENITVREFESRVFANAMRPFLASTELRQLMAGKAPAEPVAAAPAVTLVSGPALVGDVPKNTTRLLEAVVTIASDKGTGSGFFLADGQVLTNRHVVGSSKYVKVKLASGKELVGEVVREDAARDVALLKTEPAALSPLHIVLAEPKVGADVYAIGSPLGQQLAGSLTRGVLSGARDTGGARYLQSDVAINPGNSGGPLLDASGNVVGIAAAKIVGMEGLAFFIPIRDALEKLGVKLGDAP